MKFSPLLPAGALFLSAALASHAQTLTANSSGDPGTYDQVQDYAVGEVTFNNSTGSGTDPYSFGPLGMKETEAVFPDGSEMTFYDVCAELFVGPTGESTLDVSSGFGPLNATQESRTRALYTNALPQFISARNSLDYEQASIYGAAIQLIMWEIIEDGNPVISLDEGGANPGALSIDSSASDGGDTATAAAQAESWMGNIENGTWTDQGGLVYYYGSVDDEQDRFWVAVPEPSVALLSLLGSAFLLRRRRA